MIRPLLEHCNIVHNSGKKLKSDKSDNIKSKCVRIIENCNIKAHRKKENMLNYEYKIVSLQSRRHMQFACFIYRYSRNQLFTDESIKRKPKE